MTTIGGDLKVITELSLYEGDAGSGHTIDVGHEYQGITYLQSAALINAGITAVTDITDPPAEVGEDWTDIISLTNGKYLIQIEEVSADLMEGFLRVRVDENEDADDALRAQVVIDGEIVGDFTCTKDVAAVENEMAGKKVCGAHGSYHWHEFECEDSFLIRAAREGTFADDDSHFEVGEIHYMKLA